MEAIQRQQTRDDNTFSIDRVAMVAGGLYLLGNGLRHGSIWRSLLGGYLAYRGIAGDRTFGELYQWTSDKIAAGDTLNTRVAMVINRPRSEVYRAWRNLSNLPLFMEHLVQVREDDAVHSDWELRLPAGMGTVRWKAEIVKERENEMIAWRSIEGSEVRNAGKVGFRDALGGEGTMVEVVMNYNAPLGKPGEKVAKLFNPALKKMITKDIQEFKNFVELGSYRSATVTVFP